LKTLVVEENQNLRAISDTTRLNPHQSSICDPLYKRRWFKHRNVDEPFEIKARNPCSLESEDHKTIPAQEEIRSQIVKKKMSLFEATKKRPNNLEKLLHALITILVQINGTREGFFSHGSICHKTQQQTES